uniref:Integrin, alpha 3b n=1 Tax=Scleropages formosus TaxID=113540 RepID=A0A8C9R1I2_SCLFO
MASAPLRMTLKDLFTVIIISSYISRCCGFNLDVRFPVVKEGTTKGSFFGLSVALHNQTDGSKSRYLLLTGAPKEKAQPFLKVNETGAVYSCPITTDTADCTRMDLITSTNPLEMLEGMWLGVTVASQRDYPGGRVLACGHRYVKVIKDDLWRMIGMCYVRGNDLTYDDSDDWQSYRYENCNPNFDMKEEGMCNMGISGGITKTDVYVGSPGSYWWQGNVHVTWRDPNPANFLDSTNAFQNLNKHYSYIGYSVLEEKKVLDKNAYTVVTGAPRYDFKGCVILAVKGDTSLQPTVYLYGEQVGSYFGNSIAITDLNNDDWNDLIVGAPFYFDRKKEEGGAVYIFKNVNGYFHEEATMVLWGATDSGFGMAVAAIGDVNQDGFQDFAVGAPFHDSGKVYIWMGSQMLISKRPSQIIDGSGVTNGGFQTFGYSINGGMDMDDNGYPDVLVGSLDDRVALLRARPVIHLEKTFSVSPRIVDPSDCLHAEQSCVTLEVCLSYTLSNGNKDFKRNITVNYTVEADRERRNSRVFFLDNKQSIYTGFLSMPSTRCQVLNLTLVRDRKTLDKLAPVVFFLNISLYEQTPKARRALQNLDAFPVLSEKQSLWEKTEINFLNACGSDNKCTSNLQLTAKFASEGLIPFPSQGNSQVLAYDTSMKKVVLLVNVTNLSSNGTVAEDAHQAMLKITVPPSLRYSGYRATDPSIQCQPEDTLLLLLCELGNPFAGGKMAELRITFEAHGITLYTRDIQSQLQLSTVSEQSDLKPVFAILVVEYTIQTSFSVDPPEMNTYFSGKVIGESAMNSTSNVGSPVEFTFTVGMQGAPLGTMGTLEVHFEWPYEVSNGKWLLYLTEILTTGTSETHCVPPGKVVNFLNLTLSENGKQRLRREAEKTHSREPQSSITGKATRKTYLLDCEKGTAHCQKFSCPLHNMSNVAKVIVRTRVWNSTMLEDYADAFRVQVKGKATLKLATNISTIKIISDTREFTLDIDPNLGVEKKYEAPLWIIILAALAGALLLGLIVLILWKCGFFKRASRRQMYEAKGQKAEIKIQPSETERLTEDH